MICDLDCGARWMTINSEEITLPQMRESRYRGNPDESLNDEKIPCEQDGNRCRIVRRVRMEMPHSGRN
jgi:hypothetical protein